MRALALLLLLPLAFGAPLGQAITALSNFTHALNLAFSSPVPPVKLASTYYLNLSLAQGILENAKGIEKCYAEFQSELAILDTYMNTRLISPINATKALGNLRFYISCTKFYLSELTKAESIIKSQLRVVTCKDLKKSLELLPKLLNVTSVKEYLVLADQVVKLGGVRAIFGCYAKYEGSKALKFLDEAISVWKHRISNMEASYHNYYLTVEKYVGSLK